MFDGEKSNLFWVGLIILALSSLVVFTVVWQMINIYLTYLSYSARYSSSYYFMWSYIPIIVGGIVFSMIGLYMMKSGIKKDSGSPKYKTLTKKD
jgi:hypothetical protein